METFTQPAAIYRKDETLLHRRGSQGGRDIPVIEGHQILLRPASWQDLRRLGEAGYTHYVVGESFGIKRDKAHRSGQYYTIDTRDGLTIGYIGLDSLTWRSAEIRISIVEAGYRGRGYGADAIRAFTGFVFSKTSLRYLYLKVLKDNLPAITCYRKCGFRREAILKGGGHGPPNDVLLMRLERV